MAEKKLLGKITIPSEYKKWFRYVASNGEIYAVKPSREPLSEAEKGRRAEARKDKHDKVMAERELARTSMRKARLALRKNPSVANAEKFEEATKNYEEVMGR